MRLRRKAAFAVGIGSLVTAGGLASFGGPAAVVTATTQQAQVSIHPDVVMLGHRQAQAPTTADCEAAFDVACYQPTQIDNVYMELNTPMNPAGNIGAAGIIVVGSRLIAKTNLLAIGHQPFYAQTGNTSYVYWIVAHDSTHGASLPLQAGAAATNGKGNIPVTWPRIEGQNISYDVLRTEGVGNALNAGR